MARSIDVNDMLIFAQVAESGGFTAASRVLDIPKSTVSRRVSELEAALGVRLLQRTTRTLSLTDVGRAWIKPHVLCPTSRPTVLARSYFRPNIMDAPVWATAGYDVAL